jgi:hypothetical protein
MSERAEEPEVAEWFDHVLRDMVPMLEQSAVALSLVPESGEYTHGDAKFWVELGASLMMDKPLLVVAFDDRELPAKLLAVADEVVALLAAPGRHRGGGRAAAQRARADSRKDRKVRMVQEVTLEVIYDDERALRAVALGLGGAGRRRRGGGRGGRAAQAGRREAPAHEGRGQRGVRLGRGGVVSDSAAQARSVTEVGPGDFVRPVGERAWREIASNSAYGAEKLPRQWVVTLISGRRIDMWGIGAYAKREDLR